MKETAERIFSTADSLHTGETRENLNDLIKERKNHGDKLLKAGAILLILPDPITDAAAIPVLAAGKILSSRKSSNLKDVYSDLSKTIRSLAAVSSSL